MIEIRLLTAADANAYWELRLESLELEAQAFSSSAEEHRRRPPLPVPLAWF
jgi:hypothetical protein